MPVSIEQCTFINIGGKLSWKLKPSQSVNVDGETFVKIAPSDSNLVRVICEGILDPKLLKNGSLSQCIGLKDDWPDTYQARCPTRVSRTQLVHGRFRKFHRFAELLCRPLWILVRDCIRLYVCGDR